MDRITDVLCGKNDMKVDRMCVIPNTSVIITLNRAKSV